MKICKALCFTLGCVSTHVIQENSFLDRLSEFRIFLTNPRGGQITAI